MKTKRVQIRNVREEVCIDSLLAEAAPAEEDGSTMSTEVESMEDAQMIQDEDLAFPDISRKDSEIFEAESDECKILFSSDSRYPENAPPDTSNLKKPGCEENGFSPIYYRLTERRRRLRPKENEKIRSFCLDLVLSIVWRVWYAIYDYFDDYMDLNMYCPIQSALSKDSVTGI